MIRYFQKMLSSLNANTAPGELAHAFAIGMLLAFVPKGNLLWILLFIISFFLRINRGTMLLTILLGSIFTPLLDPIIHKTGYLILTAEPLSPFFANLLEIPLIAYTKFNNTVVMGSLTWGICLYIPFYILYIIFIRFWRNKLYSIFIKSRIYRIFIKIPFIQNLWNMKGVSHE